MEPQFDNCCPDYQAVCVAPPALGPFEQLKQLLSSDDSFKMPPAGVEHGAHSVTATIDILPIVDYDTKGAIHKAVSAFVKDFYVDGEEAENLVDLFAVLDGGVQVKRTGVKSYLLDTLIGDQARAAAKDILDNTGSFQTYILVQFVDYGAEVFGGDLVLVIDDYKLDQVLGIQVDFSYYD